jgi:hypothetical protein
LVLASDVLKLDFSPFYPGKTGDWLPLLDSRRDFGL